MAVQHVVALSFKPTATQQQIDAFFSEAEQLAKDVPGITAFQVSLPLAPRLQ